MLRNCNLCPDLESLKLFILQVLNNGYSYRDLIKFREWVITDRCELIIQHIEISDFIDKAIILVDYVKK